METWLRFFVAALAVWRLSFLLAREDGPWDLCARWRRSLGKGFFGSLFGCVKCLSVWIAIPFALFVCVEWLERGVAWLALSGVACLIDEWTRPAFEWKESSEDELLRRDGDGAAQ